MLVRCEFSDECSKTDCEHHGPHEPIGFGENNESACHEMVFDCTLSWQERRNYNTACVEVIVGQQKKEA